VPRSRISPLVDSIIKAFSIFGSSLLFICFFGSLPSFAEDRLDRLRLADVFYLEDVMPQQIQVKAVRRTLLTFSRDGSSPMDTIEMGQSVRVKGFWENRYLVQARVSNGGLAEGWVVTSDFESIPEEILKEIQKKAVQNEKLKQAIAKGEVEIGMSQEDILKILGKPKSKSSITEAGGKFEQWTYTSYKTVPYYVPAQINGTNTLSTFYRKISTGTKIVTFQDKKVIRFETKDEENPNPSGGQTIIPPVYIQ